jgi:hypothetical protein
VAAVLVGDVVVVEADVSPIRAHGVDGVGHDFSDQHGISTSGGVEYFD